MSENQPNMIRLSETGMPFPSEQAAREYIKSKELDRTNFVPKKYQGGWAVIDLEATVAAAAGQMVGEGQAPAKAEKYFEVEFNPPSSANDCPHVPLIVNNWDIRVQRGKPVILPERFLEAAKNATFTHYAPDETSGIGKQPLKAQGTIMRYPFRIIRESNREEFQSALAKGNGIQNEWLQSLKRSAP